MIGEMLKNLGRPSMEAMSPELRLDPVLGVLLRQDHVFLIEAPCKQEWTTISTGYFLSAETRDHESLVKEIHRGRNQALTNHALAIKCEYLKGNEEGRVEEMAIATPKGCWLVETSKQFRGRLVDCSIISLVAIVTLAEARRLYAKPR